jgi:NAD(P)-dependent dehydrogenase (short-subunit alcohol dehydrogenase family)
MDEFQGKGAFITGAASGIGLGMARAFAGAGMKVAMADIEKPALDAAVAEIGAGNAQVIGIHLDVSDRAAVAEAARQAADAFGKLHVLCNNAGVGGQGLPLDETPAEDWDWVFGVNLYGTINGLLAVLPLIKSHGEGGHVVNTSSMSGHRSVAGRHQGVYVTTKFALVGMSETLSQDLAAHGIGVTVLCPSFVRTKMPQGGRNRPERYGGPFIRSHGDLEQGALNGRDPNEIGEEVLDAIRANELYLFTDATQKNAVTGRHRRVEAALDRAAAHGTSRD